MVLEIRTAPDKTVAADMYMAGDEYVRPDQGKVVYCYIMVNHGLGKNADMISD